MSKLDDIKLFENPDDFRVGLVPMPLPEETRQQIKALILEIIGPDDTTEYPSGTARKAVQIGGNAVRAEQRKRLEEL